MSNNPSMPQTNKSNAHTKPAMEASFKGDLTFPQNIPGILLALKTQTFKAKKNTKENSKAKAVKDLNQQK